MSAREEWRIVARNPCFAVSSLGRVRKIEGGHGKAPGHIMRQKPNSMGYPRVCWRVDGRPRYVLVHHLVCEAFHGPRPSPEHHAAHNDGDPSNCRSDNLRWATRQENAADKVRHGTAPRGLNNGNTKFSPEVVQAVRADERAQKDIAAAFGMSPAHVSMIRSGQTRVHQ